MAIDRSFGSAGGIWTGVPSARRDFQGAISGTVYLGGTATGLNPDPAGPVLVVEGLRPGAPDQMTRVLCIRFAPDGHPAEVGRFDGALAVPASSATWANVLASCPAPAGGTAVLVAERESPFTLDVTRYAIRELVYSSSAAGIAATLPVPAGAVQETHDGFSVRLVGDGTGYCVASASGGTVRVSTVPRSGPALVSTGIVLGGAGSALPGLSRLDLASARLDGGFLALALTAYLQHPGVGPVSLGALLRLGRDGSRDASFGDNGLWVSPLTNVYRQFVCAGEFGSGLAGIQGDAVVAFGIAPGGAGGDALDDPFGVGGTLQKALGGALSAPVSADDGSHTYVFARRADGAVVGCRFDRQGAVDAAFGAAGIASVDAPGEAATPAAAAVAGGRVMLATTRQVQGWDCDRIPALAALDAATGRPVQAFGAGGFALHSAVGMLAAVGPDGSGFVTERRADYELWPGHRSVPDPTELRRFDAGGRYVGTVQIAPPGVATPSVASLQALDDGSVLVSGYGQPAWIAKLTPSGGLDPAFGNGGVAVPQPGVAGTISVVGVRADGRIAIRFDPDLVNPHGAALLHADGSLDLTYAPAANGFRELFGQVLLPGVTGNLDPIPIPSTATPFLDADGSIIIAAATLHTFDSDPYVHFGLRRIEPDGDYDTTFGLGAPSLAAPAAGRLMQLTEPIGTSSPGMAYSMLATVGVAWMGGKVYVVAAGTAGGVFRPAYTTPAYSVLVLTRWQADGSYDNTFGTNGVQEAGFDPDRLDFSPRGVLQYLADELLVYGEAGRAETETHQVGGGTPYTVTIVRRPEPALFRIYDPGGLDTAPGHAVAEVFPTQEFRAQMIGARLIPATIRRGSDHVRFVCSDAWQQPAEPKDPTTTFGGIGQFALPRRLLWPV